MYLYRNDNQYCLLFWKKSVIEACFILSNLLWLILLKTFWRKGFNSESVVNSVNLLRILIAPSTSFRDGGEIGSSVTSSSSLLIFSTVSAGCGIFNYFINRQWPRFVGHHISVKINESISANVFGSQVWPSFAKLIQLEL